MRIWPNKFDKPHALPAKEQNLNFFYHIVSDQKNTMLGKFDLNIFPLYNTSLFSLIVRVEMGRIETLCWLASNGNLSEIKKNNYNAEEINAFVYDFSFAVWGEAPSFLGTYNALMIAASYRHLNVVKYFVEEKAASLTIKGGRWYDFTALDCAKRKGWFGPAVDANLVTYMENWMLQKNRVSSMSVSRAVISEPKFDEQSTPNPRNYIFTIDEKGKPKAILNSNTLKDETEEQKQKRQALDTIDMINNVLAHGAVVGMETPNSILATIATKYINYLTTSFNFKIEFNLCSKAIDNHEGAINIFNELKMEFPTQKELEQIAWYQKAVKFQETYNQEFESTKNSITNSNNYIFTIDEKGYPKAVLNNNTLKNETEEKKQKRQALNTIDMINKVLAHGAVVRMETPHPILATIATKYINYLTTSFNFKIEFNLCSKVIDNHEGAINIFNELKMEFPTQKELEQTSWYQKAVEFQKAYKKDELSAEELYQERKQQDTHDADTLSSKGTNKKAHYTTAPESSSLFKSHTTNKIPNQNRASEKRQPEKPPTVKSLIPQELLSDDKEEMFLLAQFHQLDHIGMKKDLNLSFDYYIRAARLGHPEALTLLDHIGDEMNADKQLELSQLYETFFQNDEKADYWRTKAAEIVDFNFNM